ncbi:MAG: dTDP-glucose 4,6 dehydratase [Methanomassiliicoccales archaeon PtaU1.Bin124]|nr:MAG: dTDP-glucose 4,6 dehydratase [Methanomassiliicoccales archaeon PtaU1.Bin124]
MRIMVTGAAGFIGTNYVYRLLKTDAERIVCYDALTYAGCLANLDEARKDRRVLFVKGDVADAQRVDSVIREEEVDTIVHFAAESHVDRSIEHPEVFLQTNIMGTHALLEACRVRPVRRLHLVSTDEVYGDLPLDRPDLRFTEASPLRPSSPYSASKASADLLALSYHRTYSLPITVSRCTNNYGPYQVDEKLIPKMISLAMRDEELPLYGSGDFVRDWLHVDDHCSAIDLIIKKGRNGEVYNVGANNEWKNIDLVRLILKELNRPESLITYARDRPGHDRRYAIDSTKIRKELGWVPRVEFRQGIRDTVEWYLKAKVK